jgi:benzylsuccinate CoA-transferase BbsF subunit
MARPLQGIRVLDFTHVLAGPFATRVLGDLGADVVKVSSAARAGKNDPNSAYYIMWNRNKRSVALNMESAEAKRVARQLCEAADVVIDNFSVGVLDRWGIGYESVREANPGVTYVAMSGVGHSGPWSEFVTYAPTIHALSGITQMTGVAGHKDLGVGVSFNDHLSGLHGTVAVLAAIEERGHSGLGQFIDLSQLEVGASLAAPGLLDFFGNGHVAQPVANGLPYDDAAPHNAYRCAGDDQWVTIAIMTDDQWRRFKAVLGHPSWTNTRSLDTAAGRVAAAARLDEHIAAWARSRSPGYIQTLCQQAGVPAGVVQSGQDLAEHDPQLRHRRFIDVTDDAHALRGPLNFDRLPMRFPASPAETHLAPRQLGEDNAAVFGEWIGMDGEAVLEGEADGTFV